MKKPNLSKQFKMVLKAVEKRSPEILTGIGVAGMITTTVLAVKSTPKALTMIEHAEKEKARTLNESLSDSENMVATQNLTAYEVIKVAWKPYVPAMLLGAASTACLIGANSVHARRHAALYSAYKLSETALTEYKEKVEEVVTDKKVKEIKQKITEDKVEKTVTAEKKSGSKSTVIMPDDGDVWFIDPFSNRPFLSTTNKIEAAVNRMNKNLMDDMFVSLSDFYDELDNDHLGSTILSDNIGWGIDDGLIELDFSEAVVNDGKPYIVMDFLRRPAYGYDDKSKWYA